MKGHGVQPEELEQVYPLVTEFLLKIPRLSERYSLDAVYTEIEAGNWQLWIMFDERIEGALLTTLVQFPLRRELHMLGVSGTRMKEWVDLISMVEAYASQNECDGVIMQGVRRGFGRLLPDYHGNRIILEKKL